MDLSNNPRKDTNNENSWQWHTTFIGQYMQHNYYLYYLIDKIMDSNQLAGIVEIGTGCGALTSVLGMWGIVKNIPVLSVDHKNLHNAELFKHLHISYLQMDEFSNQLINEVMKFINQRGPVLFICDGGNKIKEFNMWAPILKPGSIIATHDWTTEIDYDSIRKITEKYCEPFLEDKWNAMNVQFAMFKVRFFKPFLSIVTRNHPSRRNLLDRCKESVIRQRDSDFEHVIIYDPLGAGVPHANTLFFSNRHRVNGEYVFILDDDDVLVTDDFVEDMKYVAKEQNYPDIIFVLTNLHRMIYPTEEVWMGSHMIQGHIGSSCLIVRNELWQAHIESFKTTETAGDFNFINAVFTHAKSVYWYGKQYSAAANLNYGRSEDDIENSNRSSLPI